MTPQLTGVAQVVSEINRRVNALGGGSERGLLKAGLFLKKESMKQVPVDTGFLKNSAITPQLMRTMSNRIYVAVGYSAVYAPIVHENPYAGRTHGFGPRGQKYSHWARKGKWKFLEDPLKANVRALTGIISGSVRGAIRRNP